MVSIQNPFKSLSHSIIYWLVNSMISMATPIRPGYNLQPWPSRQAVRGSSRQVYAPLGTTSPGVQLRGEAAERVTMEGFTNFHGHIGEILGIVGI